MKKQLEILKLMLIFLAAAAVIITVLCAGYLWLTWPTQDNYSVHINSAVSHPVLVMEEGDEAR